MAINMSEFASEWFGNGGGVALPPAPPPVQVPVPQPAPVAAPAPVTQPIAQPAHWRRCPDGSIINSDYALDWGGEVGDPHARVQIRHASGQVMFDGSYAQLLSGQIPGVWIPGATLVDDEQPAGATAYGDRFNGMGASTDKYSTVKKVAGGLLLAGSLGAAIWAGWGLVSGKSPPEEEDD